MADDRRLTDRRPVDLHVTCRVPATACEAVMCNISTGGCMLENRRPLFVGSTILVMLPSCSETAGTVVWSRGRFAGVQFVAPLSAALVEMIAGSPGHDIAPRAA